MSDTSAKLVDFNGTSKELKYLDEISKMTHKVLKEERKINITMYEAIPTIAYEFLYSVAQFLDKNKKPDEDIVVNIMNLLDVGVTYRESEDGEKAGNFTPYVQPGVILKTTIKSDDETEDDE